MTSAQIDDGILDALFMTSKSSLAPSRPPQLLEQLASYVRIAHQIPGRVRLKFDMGALNNAGLASLVKQGSVSTPFFTQIHGVHRIDWNLLARSCTIEYDSNLIPDTAWRDLLAGDNSDAARTLYGLLENTVRTQADGQGD